MKGDKAAYLFIFLALITLIMGVFIGCMAGFQYVYPDLAGQYLPFYKTRPMHVTLVITWIVLCASGGVYHYITKVTNTELYSPKLAFIHFMIFLLSGIIIFISYSLGFFGGREYLEFNPLLSIPILAGWVLFCINYFKTLTINTSLKRGVKKWPVYLWMWATGILFFIFTFLEAHLWLVPYFRDNIIRDITVQWKAYGAMIGAWNMLVYGTAIYVMHKIHHEEKLINGKLPFFLYFLGLVNLMFGWGHHTYILPSESWIRHFAYLISMTELIILGILIWNWKRSLSRAQKHLHSITYLFLFSSDFWIILNLLLAISISVPFINFYTHGTHITVAHAMGTTIGINTTILLSSVFFIISEKYSAAIQKYASIIKKGFYLFHVALLIFWLCLISGGVTRSYFMYFDTTLNFREIQLAIKPYMFAFMISGLGIFIGLLMVTVPVMIVFYKAILFKKKI